jgi:hypothetical protein
VGRVAGKKRYKGFVTLCNLVVIATLKWTNLVGQEVTDDYSAKYPEWPVHVVAP